VQIVALVGILAAIGAFFGLSMLGGSPAAPVSHVNPHPFGKQTSSARKGSAKKTAPLATPKVKRPGVKRKTAARTRVLVAADGLPVSISRALARHGVVVAVLYDPQSRVDAISLAEAKAGAAMAHVGYVPVNVLNRAEVQAIAEQLGVIHAPTVLIFRRPVPGEPPLYVQLGGFADKETVAQAAENAAPVG
jgi:hypothetical protein